MDVSTNGGRLEQLQPRFQPQPLSKAAEKENPASLESHTNSGRPLCRPENLRCHGNQQHHCVQYNGGPCAGVSMGTRAPAEDVLASRLDAVPESRQRSGGCLRCRGGAGPSVGVAAPDGHSWESAVNAFPPHPRLPPPLAAQLAVVTAKLASPQQLHGNDPALL